MGGHHVSVQPLAELVGDAFGQTAGVDEHERGALLSDQDCDAIQHVTDLLSRGDSFEFAFRQFERQVEVAPNRGRGHW